MDSVGRYGGEKQELELEVCGLAEEVRVATLGEVEVDGQTLERERLVAVVAFDRKLVKWRGGRAMLKLQVSSPPEMRAFPLRRRTWCYAQAAVVDNARDPGLVALGNC